MTAPIVGRDCGDENDSPDVGRITASMYGPPVHLAYARYRNDSRYPDDFATWCVWMATDQPWAWAYLTSVPDIGKTT